MANPSHIDLKGNTNYVMLRDTPERLVVSATAASDQVTIGGYTVTNIDTSSGYKITANKYSYIVPRTTLAALDLVVGPGISVVGNTISASDAGVLFVAVD